MLHPDPKVARGEISSEGWIGTGSGQMVEEGLVQSGSSADQTASIRLGDSGIPTRGSKGGCQAEHNPQDPSPIS